MEPGKTYYIDAADYGKIIVDAGGKSIALPPMKKDPNFIEAKGQEIGAVLRIKQDKAGDVRYEIVNRCAKLSDVTYG